jgi:hypothetical protein
MAKKTSGKRRGRHAELTVKQSRLVQAFAAGAETKAEAARAAGFSGKWPTKSANQALKSIREKTPDIMDRLGLTVPGLIENHLKPLLHAEETKVFVSEGKRGKRNVMRVKVPDFTTRRYGTRMAFELQNAFPPVDQKLAAQIGVKVLIVDIPRPPREAINVTPQKAARLPVPADPRAQQ